MRNGQSITSVLFALAIAPSSCVGPDRTVHAKPDPPTAVDASLKPVRTSPINPDEGPRAVFSRPLQRLVVEFRVHLVTAPRGTFGPESPLWKLAAGRPSDAQTTLRLRANGFRAAVGRESDRDGLMKLLDGIQDVRMKMDQVRPDVDRPVFIELGPGPAFQTVFHYDRAGVLHGIDLVDASARFQLQFELRSTNLKEVTLRVTPELEEPPGRLTWQRDETGQLREMPERHLKVFDDLATVAKIPEGGFLVLGSTEALTTAPIPGRVFFIDTGSSQDKTDEEPRDRIFIISPIVQFAGEPSGR